MQFEYKPSEDVKSFNEFIDYILKSSPGFKVINAGTTALVTMTIALITIPILAMYYDIFAIVTIIYIVALLLVIFVGAWLIKLIIKTKNKKLSANNFIDNDTTFYFTIENNYLIRENEHSKLQISLSDINSIDILNNGLVLKSDKASVFIFIPKVALTVSLDEFLEVFKASNALLEVGDFNKKVKKVGKRYKLSVVAALVLSILVAYFVGRYNYESTYTEYNLIMQSELVKKDFNNTYLYDNKEFGLGIYFPERWDGKYGIEELGDRINVYYLPKGKQGPRTTLLFTVSNSLTLDSIENLNFIRIADTGKAKFMFFGPKEVSKITEKEYDEYKEMYKDILNLDTR